jgi:hypothetical protein|tara:strand:- start:122 stop:313 length:192 start_codon:yes stop_codon:yes gene_type:complete
MRAFIANRSTIAYLNSNENRYHLHLYDRREKLGKNSFSEANKKVKMMKIHNKLYYLVLFGDVN